MLNTTCLNHQKNKKKKSKEKTESKVNDNGKQKITSPYA
jgi:hypothetical protein